MCFVYVSLPTPTHWAFDCLMYSCNTRTPRLFDLGNLDIDAITNNALFADNKFFPLKLCPYVCVCILCVKLHPFAGSLLHYKVTEMCAKYLLFNKLELKSCLRRSK